MVKGRLLPLLLPPSVHRTLLTQYYAGGASGRSSRRAQKAYVDNEENVIATLSTAYFHDVSTAQFTLR